VDLSKGEHKKPEFLAINPNGKVPALKDGNIYLYESSSIIRYLSNKHRNQLLPFDDVRTFGLIDAAYTLIRSTLWESTSKLVFLCFVLPTLGGKEPNQAEVTFFKNSVEQSLEFIEKNFFKQSKYIVGSNLSIADIALGTNLSHLEIINFDLSKYPNILKFWLSIQYSDAYLISHALFYKILNDLKYKTQPKAAVTQVIPVNDNIIPFNTENRGEHLRLFHIPGTRGTRVLWLAYELGLDLIRVVQVKWTQLQKKEFLDINPNGLIPAMVDESLPDNSKNMFEAGAICDYLLGVISPNNNLLPKTWTNDNWARHFVWKHWTVVTLDGRLISKMFGSGKVGNIINKTGRKIFQTLIFPMVDRDLEDNLYINGNEFSATDIYVGYTLFLAENLKLIVPDSRIANYYARLKERPAWGRAFPDHL